ncbi:MAG: hypothetical protein HY204_09235 [Nitrospirae bacterium]|nr:hypothetical protein [Nitrospirota bacterium]
MNRETVLSWRRGFVLILSLFLASSLLMGCGGGGGGSGNGGGGTGTISGTVSGTSVIAVNGSGDIIAIDDTTGRTPDANGNFSFTLTGIPVGVNIRVYLVEGGGIFPVYFDTNGDGVPDTNVFSLSSVVTINLGFVDTNVAGQIGRAIPQNNPTGNPGVSGGTENTVIPPP